jgi:hypothetical protein
MSAATNEIVKKHSNRVMGAYEALFPFISIARRDGPALLSQAIATARNDADGTVSQQTFGRQVTVLKLILETLIKLPAPEGVKEDEHFDIPSAPSPRLALMSRYRDAGSNDLNVVPDKLK